MDILSYPIKYRQQVMKVKKEEGLTWDKTAERFGVSRSILFEWKKQIEPKSGRNKPATKIDMEELAADVEQNPDKYQYERAKDYGVSQPAILYAMKRLKISRKKNFVSPEGGRSETG